MEMISMTPAQVFIVYKKLLLSSALQYYMSLPDHHHHHVDQPDEVGNNSASTDNEESEAAYAVDRDADSYIYNPTGNVPSVGEDSYYPTGNVRHGVRPRGRAYSGVTSRRFDASIDIEEPEAAYAVDRDVDSYTHPHRGQPRAASSLESLESGISSNDSLPPPGRARAAPRRTRAAPRRARAAPRRARAAQRPLPLLPEITPLEAAEYIDFQEKEKVRRWYQRWFTYPYFICFLMNAA